MSEKKEEVLYREVSDGTGQFITYFLAIIAWSIGLFVIDSFDHNVVIRYLIYIAVYSSILFNVYFLVMSIIHYKRIEIQIDGVYIFTWFRTVKHIVLLKDVSRCGIELRNDLIPDTIISREKKDLNNVEYGCHGVRIEYENGDEVFIGSNKKEELLEAIEKAIKMKMDS